MLDFMINRGFSLIELVTAMAIVSVLAAIALPQVYVAQLKSKSTELVVNTDGMTLAQVAYESANDGYVQCSPYAPSWPPGKERRPWEGATATCFDRLGWAPDGWVYASYLTLPFPAWGLPPPLTCDCDAGSVAMGAVSDLDGDWGGVGWVGLRVVGQCLPVGTEVTAGLCSPVEAY